MIEKEPDLDGQFALGCLMVLMYFAVVGGLGWLIWWMVGMFVN